MKRIEREGGHMRRVLLGMSFAWILFIFYQGTRPTEQSLENSDYFVQLILEIKETFEEFKQQFNIKEPQEQISDVQPQSMTSEGIQVQTQLITPEASQSTQSQPQSTTNTVVSVNEVTHSFEYKLSYLVRKSAHFFEYAILAVLLCGVMKSYHHTWWNQIIYTLFIVLMVAVLDEYFQSFVGRTSMVQDVLIDFSGGIFGFAIGSLLFRKLNK